MLTPKERLNQLTEYYDMKVKRFAEKVGLSPANLYEITYGKTKTISLNVADHIKEAFPYVSMEWLLTGRGEMMDRIDGDDTQTDTDSPTHADHGTEPGGSSAGKLPGPFADCEIYGNFFCTTMRPAIEVGDQLLVSKWTERFITWGKVYIVETKKGNTTIAYLFPSDKEDRYICRSADAEKHPDVEMPLSDIKSLRIVRAKMQFL